MQGSLAQHQLGSDRPRSARLVRLSRLNRALAPLTRRKDLRRPVCCPAMGFGTAEDAKIKLDWRERPGKKPLDSRRRRKGLKREDDPKANLVRSGPTRIAKAMAAAGVDSRRKCEALVMEGKVKVNGDVVTEPGTLVDLNKDSLRVCNRAISTLQPKVYFMLNKPKGYICSTVPQEGLTAKPVLSIFGPYFKKHVQGQPVGTKPPRLFTVGRLDVNTTGLLLVTSDGTWAQRIAHPATGIHKEYVARVNKRLTAKDLKALAEGCALDGVFVQPVFVGLAGTDSAARDRIRIVVQQGRYREVRRLIEHCGMDCLQLKRHRIGGLSLPKDLPIGRYRELKAHEVRAVADDAAQHSSLYNKLNRIATSGLAPSLSKNLFRAKFNKQ